MMNRIHTKNTQNFESKLHYSPDSWANLGVGQVDRGHLFFCDILYYFLCVTFQRRRWLYVGQLVYIDGFSNLSSVFSFQIPFQQLSLLILVSFTSCELHPVGYLHHRRNLNLYSKRVVVYSSDRLLTVLAKVSLFGKRFQLL